MLTANTDFGARSNSMFAKRQWIASERIMDFQMKIVRVLQRGNYVIAITRGPMDIDGFKRLFDKVIEETRPLLDCKVLIDLQDSRYQLLPAEVAELADSIDLQSWPQHNKVALVSSPEIEQYQQLAMLGEGLAKRSVKITVFYDTKEAISWLSGIKG